MHKAKAAFRFIDLFAGLGGFHVALRDLGGEGVFAAEWEPTLNALYATNFGLAAWMDINELESATTIRAEIPDHDVLTAGFPCQPFSKAGEQLGFEHTLQGHLFFQVLKILRVKRPQRFILENVPNILYHRGGHSLSNVYVFFADYHDVDEALRNVISGSMQDNSDVPLPVVLQGEGFLATGKIANLGNKPLHPGRKPFVPIVNSGEDEDPNTKLVYDLFSQGVSDDVTAGGRLRGRILTEPLSLVEAASLLDQLSFDAYQPGVDNWQGELWSQVQARVNAIQSMPDGYHLYRPAAPQSGPASPVRRDCPYAIPAYFRLWEACLSRRVRGLFVTGRRDALWSMTDLVTKHRQRPNFWIGIRYGSGAPVQGKLADLPFIVPVTQKQVNKGGIRGTWGANKPDAGPDQYRGDEYATRSVCQLNLMRSLNVVRRCGSGCGLHFGSDRAPGEVTERRLPTVPRFNDWCHRRVFCTSAESIEK
ncbi:hypothetical protein MDOR_31050 [Mycolicibacterium doricum]|uniref:Cytosine-specific methyltransferase n=1 Tax=Mycolicibacterium doricum TaxID=126673 RepID=A0A1X1SXL4_9MYCO|nr:DNA (cytosine-5-)-methyltransferase [Mycolicibacterium doricum]ORV35799.1 hypothetical protein AWC01_17975 [Mycolicibacterium doricum]BBZ08936.1 hypothetical protein MDOR_31050 [Mycolicibacterium doricum]